MKTERIGIRITPELKKAYDFNTWLRKILREDRMEKILRIEETTTLENATVGVACKNLNRNFIGIEINKSFVDIAKNRIEQARQEGEPKLSHVI